MPGASQPADLYSTALEKRLDLEEVGRPVIYETQRPVEREGARLDVETSVAIEEGCDSAPIRIPRTRFIKFPTPVRELASQPYRLRHTMPISL